MKEPLKPKNYAMNVSTKRPLASPLRALAILALTLTHLHANLTPPPPPYQDPPLATPIFSADFVTSTEHPEGIGKWFLITPDTRLIDAKPPGLKAYGTSRGSKTVEGATDPPWVGISGIC